MRTSSWAGVALMPLKLGLVLLWQMSDQAFISGLGSLDLEVPEAHSWHFHGVAGTMEAV